MAVVTRSDRIGPDRPLGARSIYTLIGTLWSRPAAINVVSSVISWPRGHERPVRQLMGWLQLMALARLERLSQ